VPSERQRHHAGKHVLERLRAAATGAGCHGQDYGETSPNSGQPKATAYGLRLFHGSACPPVPSCGTTGCHKPGTQGHPNPFPPLLSENVPPPYYNALFSNLTNPCASSQEDIPFDADSVGLDNDGDGFADWPADSDCPQPPTPTPTPMLGVACGTAPAVLCIAPEKGSLLVNEEARQEEDQGSQQAAGEPHPEPVRQPDQRHHGVRALHLRRREPTQRRVYGRSRRRHLRWQAVLGRDLRQGLQVQRQGHDG
jgi:hypothetical protein